MKKYLHGHDRIWIPVVFLLTCLAYLPAIPGGWIWDDAHIFIVNNRMLHSLRGLADIWFSTKPIDYYPLTFTSFWIEWRLWGLHPAGYHVTNILLHAVNAVLLGFVLKRLRIPAAWLVAALFALHPVNVETVAWISERKNTLSMLFYLLAGLCFLKTERYDRVYVAALGLFVLSLLAKTGAVMLPVVLLGAAWWLRRRITWRDVCRTVPFFAVSLAYGLFTIWYHCFRREFVGARTDGFMARLVGAGCNVLFYLWKAVVPLRLSFVYPRWEPDATVVWEWIPGLVLAAMLVAAWWFRRQRYGRAALAGLGYYVVSLFPVAGFVGVAFMQFMSVADHCQYYAITGVVALLVAAWTAVLQRVGVPLRVRAGLAGAVVLVAFGLTCSRAAVFRSEQRVYRDAIRKNPGAFLAHLHLGNILYQDGHGEAALEHYKAAAEWGGHLAETHFNLGTMRLGRGVELEEAIEDFTRVLRIKPSRAEAYFKRGAAKLRLGTDLVGALSDFNATLLTQPTHAGALHFRGRLLTRWQDLAGAVHDYARALECAPPDWEQRVEVTRLLAATILAMRQRAVAAGDGPAVDPQKKQVAQLLLLRGSQRFSKGEDLDKAVVDFNTALELDPGSVDARRMRGMTRLRLATDLAGAYEDLSVVIREQPATADAWCMRGRLKLALRDMDGAIRDAERALSVAPDGWALRKEAERIAASARLALAARDQQR